jgi:hypothetical protein
MPGVGQSLTKNDDSTDNYDSQNDDYHRLSDTAQTGIGKCGCGVEVLAAAVLGLLHKLGPQLCMSGM